MNLSAGDSLPECPSEPTLYPNQVNRVIVPASADTMRTKRLILRPLALSDAEDIFAYRRLGTVADWIHPKIPHKDVQETRDFITRTIFTTPDASGVVGRQFFFAIILADDPTEKATGTVGVNALSPAPSIGYCTHPSTWGRGLASEAVAALVDAWWKLPRIDLKSDGPSSPERLFAACSTENAGSLKVLWRNGFTTCKMIWFMEEEIALLELEKPQSD